MTPEELVEASSLNGQIERNTLLDLAEAGLTGWIDCYPVAGSLQNG